MWELNLSAWLKFQFKGRVSTIEKRKFGIHRGEHISGDCLCVAKIDTKFFSFFFKVSNLIRVKENWKKVRKIKKIIGNKTKKQIPCRSEHSLHFDTPFGTLKRDSNQIKQNKTIHPFIKGWVLNLLTLWRLKLGRAKLVGPAFALYFRSIWVNSSISHRLKVCFSEAFFLGVSLMSD